PSIRLRAAASRPPRSPRMSPLPPPSTLFPYTTLFRSRRDVMGRARAAERTEISPAARDLSAVVHSRRPTREASASMSQDRLHLQDRKSTRLNSSHVSISYAVLCLKKKRVRTRHAPSRT